MIEASKHELQKNNGSIVCISSICALKTIDGAPITYSVSKAALNAYIKNIAPCMAKHGVRVNGVAPGNIFFEGSVWDKKLKEKPEVVQEIFSKFYPDIHFNLKKILSYKDENPKLFLKNAKVQRNEGRNRDCRAIPR